MGLGARPDLTSGCTRRTQAKVHNHLPGQPDSTQLPAHPLAVASRRKVTQSQGQQQQRREKSGQALTLDGRGPWRLTAPGALHRHGRVLTPVYENQTLHQATLCASNFAFSAYTLMFSLLLLSTSLRQKIFPLVTMFPGYGLG